MYSSSSMVMTILMSGKVWIGVQGVQQAREVFVEAQRVVLGLADRRVGRHRAELQRRLGEALASSSCRSVTS